MSSSNSILSTLAGILLKALGRESRSTPVRPDRPDAQLRETSARGGSAAGEEPGRNRGSETVRVDPDRIRDLTVSYAPQRDGAPDAGEVIWTWVPYEENDGRGKDRPVLVIGRQSADRVYAVRMTSKPHDGDRDFLSIGTGGWDSQGRESWVDIEQLYSVHDRGMRREAAVLDAGRYERVASALVTRYGWARKR
ncbi:type II toxin-antitoxin system PemK/MazF family toxin [Microbacterium sp.]|uniref:type II toxin-antitoxin system PemK/MazF family toxin n=1 Tax=Microbacterium sp. TaxID=51671 RepID=UPI00333F9C41